MKTVLVSSYPKSGSTWLTSLLGDTLNCPTDGSYGRDKKEIASKDRPNKSYLVRKGHYRLVRNVQDKVIPASHLLNWQYLDDNYRVIFLVRDPRDIAVSGAYHWRCSVPEFLKRMIQGNVVHLGRWDKYVNDWLDLMQDKICCDLFYLVRYEELNHSTYETIENILYFLQAIKHQSNIAQAVHQNSFAVRSKQVRNKRRHNMRKGIVGDWRKNFDEDMNNLILSEFGETMRRLGYE